MLGIQMPFPLVASAGVILLQQEGMKQGCYCFHVSLTMLSPACQRLTEFCQKHQKNSHKVSGQTFKLSNIPYLPCVVRLLDNVCKVLQNPWMKSSMNVKNSIRNTSRILNMCGCVHRCVCVHLCACLSIYTVLYTFRNTVFRNV